MFLLDKAIPRSPSSIYVARRNNDKNYHGNRDDLST